MKHGKPNGFDGNLIPSGSNFVESKIAVDLIVFSRIVVAPPITHMESVRCTFGVCALHVWSVTATHLECDPVSLSGNSQQRHARKKGFAWLGPQLRLKCAQCCTPRHSLCTRRLPSETTENQCSLEAGRLWNWQSDKVKSNTRGCTHF
jgi:hypothetical protein